MVSFAKYTGRDRLPQVRVPQVQADTAVAGALQGVGGAITQAGDVWAARNAERKRKIDNFEREKGLLEFSSVMASREKEAAQGIKPGADGFTRDFLADFDKQSEAFLQSMPEDVREAASLDVLRLRSRFADRAAGTEYTESQRWFREGIQTSTDALATSIRQNPESYDESLAAGQRIISDSGLSAPERETLVRGWERMASLAWANELPAEERARLFGRQETGGESVRSVIRGFEGFRTKAYNDPRTDSSGKQVGPNVYRVGFGSDTVTRADGTVERVTKNTVVTKADAERDLARREKEFEGIARGQVGPRAWGALPDNVRAALVSVTYNYGELPGAVANAVREGNREGIASSVEALQGHNGGINRKRRKKEAAIIRGNGTAESTVSQPAQDVPDEFKDRLDALTYDDWVKLGDQAERDIVAADKYDASQMKEARSEATKEGYNLLFNDQLTTEWVEENRDILSASDYKSLLRSTAEGSAAKRTNPKDYIRLLDLAEADPEQAIEEVRDLYGRDLIAKDVFNKVYSRAGARQRQDTPADKYRTEMRGYVRRMLQPDSDAPRSHFSRQLDAAFSFDDWLESNQSQSREDIRKAADQIVKNYRRIRYRNDITSLPAPRYLDTAKPITPESLQEAKRETLMGLRFERLTKEQAAREADLLRKWSKAVRSGTDQ